MSSFLGMRGGAAGPEGYGQWDRPPRLLPRRNPTDLAPELRDEAAADDLVRDALRDAVRPADRLNVAEEPGELVEQVARLVDAHTFPRSAAAASTAAFRLLNQT
jgi:hypothetical protein